MTMNVGDTVEIWDRGHPYLGGGGRLEHDPNHEKIMELAAKIQNRTSKTLADDSREFFSLANLASRFYEPGTLGKIVEKSADDTISAIVEVNGERVSICYSSLNEIGSLKLYYEMNLSEPAIIQQYRPNYNSVSAMLLDENLRPAFDDLAELPVGAEVMIIRKTDQSSHVFLEGRVYHIQNIHLKSK